MSGKRDALVALGWSTDLIDSFLQSDLSAAIEDEDSPPSVVHTYADHDNLMIELPAATILSGAALRAQPQKKGKQRRELRRAAKKKR